MRIAVKDLVGPICITAEDGSTVYNELAKRLVSRHTEPVRVHLDFKGVDICASPFLNHSIGRLLKDMSKEDLDRKIVFENLPSYLGPVLEEVIENASRYYSDRTVKEAQDSVLEEEAEK